jgi:cytochrome c biogenesis protein CcmG, thiol:disulfide interchange protein DsbE
MGLKPALFLLASLFLFPLAPWVGGGSPIAASSQDGVLSPAAGFTEKDLDNRTISLKKFRGRVVLLNFWGTWCPPCQAEIPAFRRLQDEYRGRLEILGAAVFSSDADVHQFYKDYQINYPVFMGSYDLMDKYGRVSAIPTTFLINKKGEIAQKIVGSRSQAQYEEMIKTLLAE